MAIHLYTISDYNYIMGTKKDLWRSASCNLLTDERYSNARNGEERYRVSRIICKECKDTVCMFVGKDY